MRAGSSLRSPHPILLSYFLSSRILFELCKDSRLFSISFFAGDRDAAMKSRNGNTFYKLYFGSVRGCYTVRAVLNSTVES